MTKEKKSFHIPPFIVLPLVLILALKTTTRIIEHFREPAPVENQATSPIFDDAQQADQFLERWREKYAAGTVQSSVGASLGIYMSLMMQAANTAESPLAAQEQIRHQLQAWLLWCRTDMNKPEAKQKAPEMPEAFAAFAPDLGDEEVSAYLTDGSQADELMMFLDSTYIVLKEVRYETGATEEDDTEVEVNETASASDQE